MKLEKELSRLVKSINELVDVNLRTDFTEDSDFGWSSPSALSLLIGRCQKLLLMAR